MKPKTNRATRTRVAQQSTTPTLAEIKALIEQSKQPAPPPKPPSVVNVVYVFDNGDVTGGTPAMLRLVQNGENLELLNVVKTEGDKMTYHAVSIFKGMRMHKVEAAAPAAPPVAPPQGD